ncbi:tetratricopeptide repeat protein [Adhaeribacter radiodurans]|uniref:Tetratricopeptide repeat protein n=1 Tax=Adhaeribacter radiodurans TaxID=2745197 RepID=A0A7L7L6Y4_9BACT|nr:tetratricopeptide repeat protein [Adhaeribacter radiodurans]QMU28109.1 hypothetical protein HUW48_08630 [Adhaeribacter radiodurans]
MRIWIILAVLLAFFSQKLTKISRINQYLSEAQTAYNRQDFSTAIYFYKYLNDSLQVRDRAVRVNLGHAYFQQKKMGEAVKYYQPLLTKTPARMASLVNLQLGVITVLEDKSKALAYFKEALILNPLNEEARYNYEWLKKYLVLHPEEDQASVPPTRPEPSNPDKKEQKKENPNSGQKEDNKGTTQQEMPDPANSDTQNPPQPNANSNNPDNGESTAKENLSDVGANQKQEEKSGMLPGTVRGLNNDGNSGNGSSSSKGGSEASDENDNNSQTTYERLRQANLTPEKAKMLLDAMRESEVQYLQQIPRKSNRKSNSGKPDW